jgi:hypothetical protein
MQGMPPAAFGILLGVSQSVYLAAMLVLGGRLLVRALRHGEIPETLLALHFCLCCTIGYALLGGGLAAGQTPGLLSTAAIAVLVGTGQLCSALGVFFAVAFTWLVFRREERWACALMVAAGAILAVGFFGGALSGGFARGIGDPWYRVSYVGYGLSAAWVAVEPLRYWVLMRRRLALGLAEPLLVNRFLMWGVGSVCRLLMLAVGAVSAVAPVAILDVVTVSLVLCAAALLGFGVAGAYWLTFFPPAPWVRFVSGRA